MMVQDPYAPGGLRVWDDYGFRRKGIKSGGFGPPVTPGDPPILQSSPVVSGTAVVGQTLSCTTGVWAGMPSLTFGYQWKRGITNVGTGLATYLLVTADIGFLMSCLVTATRAVTSASAMSNLVGPVTATAVGTAPVNTIAPVADDHTVEAETINCSTGTWTGTAPITYEYQWYYFVPDVPTAPSVSIMPLLTGGPYVTSTLHCSTGLWVGTPPITYHYQWKRGATNVGTDSSSYLVDAADLSLSITCVVTAVNSIGSANATSSNTKGPITEAPPAEALLDDEGDVLTVDGEDLTVIL